MSVLISIVFFPLLCFAIYEFYFAWVSRNPIILTIRPTIFRAQIHFKSDIQTILNHNLDNLKAIKTRFFPIDKAIHFHEKISFFDLGWRSLFRMRTSAPVTGIINLRQTEDGVVGDVEGKVPFNQVAFIVLWVICFTGLGVYDTFKNANNLPKSIFQLIFVGFGLFIFVIIGGLEYTKFIDRIDEIIKSYNAAGIAASRNGIVVSLKKNYQSKKI